jgi:hypothetical protein
MNRKAGLLLLFHLSALTAARDSLKESPQFIEADGQVYVASVLNSW